MPGKIFYRERREVGEGDQIPRFNLVAVAGLDLKIHVTHMRKAGVASSVIRAWVGHQTEEMFSRYNTIDEGDLTEAMDRLQGYLGDCSPKVDQKSENGEA